MAIDDKLNGSEETVNQTVRVPNGVPANLPDLTDRGVPRSRWVLLAVRHRRLLICGGLGAMVLAFVLTKFVMHKKYQAQAVIRPSASQNQNSLGGLLQSTGLLGNNSPLSSQVGGPPDPNELLAILQSYDFTTAMIKQEHLAPRLTQGGHFLRRLIPFLGPPEPPSLFALYKLMSGRFDCDYSLRTGNINLSFVHKDAGLARTILALYIDRLRDQVRAQTVRDNRAALRSLEQEAGKATDPLLRDQLYQLVAFQTQQVQTAEANADFAFTVLEPAWVPPVPCAPWVALDTVAGGVLGVMMLFCCLAARELFPQLRKGLADLDSESDRRRRDLAVRPRKAPPTPEADRPYTL